MPKKRKCTMKNLPTRQCKKPKISISLRQKRGMVNYDDSKYDVLDFVDESDNLSETIEISSEDSKEKEPTPMNDIESGNSSDVVIIENKDSLFESMVSTFKDTTFIDVSAENNEENQKSDNSVPDNVIKHKSNIQTPKSSNNNLSSAVSLSSSETKSSSSGKRKKKSQKVRQTVPVVQPVPEEIFYVEKILDMKTVNGKKLFLLKWEGFPDSDNTWEPEENIQTNAMVQDFLNNLKNANKKESNKTNEPLKDDQSNLQSGIDVDNDGEKSSPNATDSKSGLDNTVLIVEDDGVPTAAVDDHQSPLMIEDDSNDCQEQLPSNTVPENSSELLADENPTKSSDEMIDTESKENQENPTQAIDLHPIETVTELEQNKSDLGPTNEQSGEPELVADVSEPAVLPAPQKTTRAKVGRRSREEMNLFRDLDNSFWDVEESGGRASRRRRRLMSLTEILNQTDDRSPSSDTGERMKTRSNVHDDQKSREQPAKSRSRDPSQSSNQDNSVKALSQAPSETAVNPPPESDQSAPPAGVKDPNLYFPSNMPQTVQEIFMVEKILKMKMINGVRKFYLKWEGFPDSENTWEPEENLECPELIKEFLKQKRLKQKIKKRKKMMETAQEVPMVLEELPEDVVIKEPVVRPRGFPRSREAESILAAGVLNDQLMFLIKWKNADMANLVSARRANLECPQLVIKFYEAHLNWQNGDDTVTKNPKEAICNNMPGEAARQAIKATMKQSGFDESVERLISRVTQGKLGGPQPIKPKLPKPQFSHPLANRFTSPRRIRKPRQKKLTPIRSLVASQAHPGLPGSRPGPDRSSVSMMNLIRNFKDRKMEQPPPKSVTPVPIARPTTVLDNQQPPLGGTCQYESRDIPREPSPVPPRFDLLPKVSAAPMLKTINSYRGDMVSASANPAIRRVGMGAVRSALSEAPPSSAVIASSGAALGPRPPLLIHYLQSAASSAVGGSISSRINEYGGGAGGGGAATPLVTGGPPSFQLQQRPMPGRPCLPGLTVARSAGGPGSLQQIHALTSSIGTLANSDGSSPYGGAGIVAYPQATPVLQDGLDSRTANRVQLAAAIQSRYQQQTSLLQQQQGGPLLSNQQQQQGGPLLQQQSMVLMHHPGMMQGAATGASPLIIYQNSAQPPQQQQQQPTQYQYVINQSPATVPASSWQQQSQQTGFYSQQQQKQQQCLMIPSLETVGSYALQGDLGQHLLHQASSQSNYLSMSPQQQLQHQQPLIKQEQPDRMQNSFMRAFL